ncbi:hypothetical protein CYY_008150 [Polysphondylium violaceum]|uniref:Adenylate kinase n=1 Tax=Polysphondylium violaceum TaxID=133409 RepID=A0A8J4V1K5_9MYCE|nr:hypothetical protein CYY_008150 [Polysphondylium violaceum]
MKILIFGASGSGTTTLSDYIESKIDSFVHLEADKYYWEKTEPPFTIKKNVQERNDSILADINKIENVVISGSLLSWGQVFWDIFDVAVFIYIPQDTRIKRLIERDKQRYGSLLETDADYRKKHLDFIEWAATYDSPQLTNTGRCISLHKSWISKLTIPVIKIEGDNTVEESFQFLKENLNKFGFNI